MRVLMDLDEFCMGFADYFHTDSFLSTRDIV